MFPASTVHLSMFHGKDGHAGIAVVGKRKAMSGKVRSLDLLCSFPHSLATHYFNFECESVLLVLKSKHTDLIEQYLAIE